MNSFHDHHVLAFALDARIRTLRLLTAHPFREGPVMAEAEFSGVEAYRFRGDALGTILFDIKEVDCIQLYLRNADALAETHQATGGHAPWVCSRSEAEKFLRANAVKGFEVSSSIGLEGAVWCRDFSGRVL
jgi:hypothetical protein